MSEARVVDAAAAPWEDVEQVFSTGGYAGCWCQFWRLDNAQLREATEGAARDMLRGSLADAPPSSPAPGLLAYVDGEPAGWCALAPRDDYRRIPKTKLIASGTTLPLGDPGVWSLTCFRVRPGFRGRGVARALLAAAVGRARDAGARTLEAYPIELSAGTRGAAGDLNPGTLSMFLGAGFQVASRPKPGRAVVTLDL